jgi:DNA-binding NarL/FixJ family response regulator
MKTLKILLADDHELVRNGIKLMLSQQKYFIPLIEEVKDGEEVLNIVTKCEFDIIILDINLPKIDGISVAKKLIGKNSNTKILALTMYKEDYVVKQMIAAGALGYLLKDTGLDELTKAILTVSASKRYYCNEASQALISNNVKQLPINGDLKLNIDFNSALSNREKEVMVFIVKELNSSEIAEKLFISKRTVDGHRKNIINKLNLKNTAGLVKYAIQNGITTL